MNIMMRLEGVNVKEIALRVDAAEFLTVKEALESYVKWTTAPQNKDTALRMIKEIKSWLQEETK